MPEYNLDFGNTNPYMQMMNNQPTFNYGGSNTMDFRNGQTTQNQSVFNSDSINADLGSQNPGGLFKDWNQQSTANAIKGVGLGANIFFGAKNLSMAKKELGMKQEQHAAFLEDRKINRAKDARVAAIRF